MQCVDTYIIFFFGCNVQIRTGMLANKDKDMQESSVLLYLAKYG